MQDNEGGLEYEDRKTAKGKYIPVYNGGEHDGTDLIVSGADILERWTNGVLKGALHRVVVPERFATTMGGKQSRGKTNGAVVKAEKDYEDDDGNDDDDVVLPARNSVVFLYRPGEEKPAGPMPQFVSVERPAIFPDISAGGYLAEKNGHIYA